MSTYEVVVGLILSVISAATTASNILVFVAVGSSQHLRTVSNLFIVSLSVADILVGTVVMIPATLNQVYGQWVLHPAFCSIWTSCDVMLCSASVLNVCAISFDRYLAIISPLRYKSLMTFRRATLLLATLWIVSVLSSFVPIKNGWHKGGDGAWGDMRPSLINLSWSGDDRPKCILKVSLSYALLAGSITILFPIVVAVILYFKVSGEARRQALFVRTLIVGPSRLLLGQDVTSSSANGINKNLRDPPFTRKSTITLGVIVGAYVVTWTPFLVVNVIQAQCACVPLDIFTAIVWLGYCNSLINPIIYPLLMRDFRKVYMRLLLSCCPRLRFILQRRSNSATEIGFGGAGAGGFNSQSGDVREEHLVTNPMIPVTGKPNPAEAITPVAETLALPTVALNGHSNSYNSSITSSTTITSSLTEQTPPTTASNGHSGEKADV
ncbi:5-hydroxytryptamine receptor 6-like protein [Plakobranchus ocellatus]|uniref:5-hydroxytryptamine receptor 6-like protein n=1 Tax=Plakobranchus ocellatus TaxID=259542 RepID=A0AAV3YV90_9GAST|nr:5-hydroxytryptamine receptor 6-like protein [Plakobranchus ocellatus]